MMILLVTDKVLRGSPTGIDNYYTNLLTLLPKFNIKTDFTVVSFGEPSNSFRGKYPNLRHVGIPVSRRKLLLMWLFGRQPQALSKLCQKADLVHLLMPLPFHTNQTTLVTIHDLAPITVPTTYSFKDRWLFKLFMRNIVKRNYFYTTISHRTALDLRQVYSISSETVFPIYLGVNQDFHKKSGARSEIRQKYQLPEKFFLYIGSMHKRKNLKTVIKSYFSFQQKYDSDYRLVLAGRMELGGNSLRKTLAEYQRFTENVLLPGYIDDKDLPTVMSMATAMLYPSLYEGFGLPILEAFTCGVPVIASNAGSIPEIAQDSAILCDPYDINAFADALYRVTTDPALCQKLVAKGRQRALQFTWEKTARETWALYHRIAGWS